MMSAIGNETFEGNKDANWLIGGSGNDILYGYGGNDTLDGGKGADTLIGGVGNDIYKVDHSGDHIVEAENEGLDTVISSASHYTLADNIENLTLLGKAITGAGNSLDNLLIGNSGKNVLIGGAGDDTLDGGAGKDQLQGDSGNDTYIVDKTSDIILKEKFDGGNDTVLSKATSYILGDNVENLTLLGTGNSNGTGNYLNNVIIGNSGKNKLSGGLGNDTLFGGAGKDTLYGGGGNNVLSGGMGDDVFWVERSADIDIVIEADDGGTDTIMAYNDYSLTDDMFIEKLILTGKEKSNARGNSHNNYISGNSNDNMLDGGYGNDTLLGGAGNDTLVYYANDILFDGGSGYDLLNAAAADQAVTIDLRKTRIYKNIEVVQGSAYDDLLYGTTSGNNLAGGIGNDYLDGHGGADTLYGGVGNDTLVYYAGRKTKFDGGAGNDVLQAVASGKKGAKISLTDLAVQCNSIEILAGTDYNDTLIGGITGSDTLDGGKGSDLFIGGVAQDTFVVGMGNDTISSMANNDIVYFSGLSANDVIGYVKTDRKGNKSMIFAGSGIYKSWNDNVTLKNINIEDSSTWPTFYFDGIAATLHKIADNSYAFGDIHDLYGTLENDSLTADTFHVIHGLSGADSLYGGTADDVLYGDGGSDMLYAIGGNDTLFGGEGNDTYILQAGKVVNMTIATDASNGNDVLWLQEEDTTKFGNTVNNFFLNVTAGTTQVSTHVDGNDILVDFGSYGTVCLDDYLVEGNTHVKLSSKEKISSTGKDVFTDATIAVGVEGFKELQANQNNAFFGLNEDDTITGGTKQNVLFGGGGHDVLTGGTGSRNFLLGGDGDDDIWGGGALDFINGGAGNDYLAGDHGGYDIYQFSAGWGNDTIDDTRDGNSIVNALSFTNMAPQDITVNFDGSALHIASVSGTDTINILGTDWNSFIFRFDVSDANNKNKYVFRENTFRPFSS